ncbi:Hypothetical Protein FCC1311_083882 [Hondaea fermentalgiana]|uniref:Uncharacterized protein n=1 Tax=Hondaea fermentalgiana TaxID=2315210 RepID=A0A2R5GU35_9STRA|nr:Hypothetical Protein FCC1311_083882 [Hondaea fermentalgiana]|eukprot:GBG32163.1 Hypothetical Protein FCC1311_083882 [Hondaea fermentalgiana]
MTSDSDSDEEMTLADLQRKTSMTRAAASASEASAVNDDEDDEESKETDSKSNGKAHDDDEDDDGEGGDDDDDEEDSDDNLTLSAFMKTRAKRSKDKISYKEVSSEDEDDEVIPNPKKPKPSPGPPSTEETAKHTLVGNILKRWQYCLPYWPDLSNVEKPPKTFIETGTKGVYVGIAPDNLGEIRDLRPRDGKAPIFSVLIKFPAKELKEDLVNGIAKQQKALEDNKDRYPSDWFQTVSKLLKAEAKTARALVPSKIDAEYKTWARKHVRK